MHRHASTCMACGTCTCASSLGKTSMPFKKGISACATISSFGMFWDVLGGQFNVDQLDTDMKNIEEP